MSEQDRYQSQIRDARYRSRLRAEGIREDELINLEKLFWGDDLAVWDTVGKCFVEKNEAGEWVPETSKSAGQQ